MIDDQELAGLFREESEEHLQNLDEGLLRLEKNPAQTEVLQEVFRSAHSLKGAARMLGVTDVEVVAHEFEELLGSAARGGSKLTLGTIEKLYGALDALRFLVREAVTGAPSGVDLNAVLLRLQAPDENPIGEKEAIPLPPHEAESQEENPEPSVEESASPIPTTEIVAFHSLDTEVSPAPVPLVPVEPVPALVAPTPRSAEIEVSIPPAPLQVAGVDPTWKIETIRVEPSRLDALLAMAGELIVATTRARRGRSEFEDLISLWEEETKGFAARRRSLSELERVLRRAALPEREMRDASVTLRDLRRLLERDEDRLNTLGALLLRLRTSYEDVARLDGVAGEMEEAIRGVRLLPLSALFSLFPRLVRDLAKLQGKEVTFVVEGGETTADKRILEELKDPLMHMLRNAVDHGLETPPERTRVGKKPEARLLLRAVQTATQVVVELRDDGRGLDSEAIGLAAVRKGVVRAEELATMSPRAIEELIFAPGFSTAATITDVSGRGVGLDVVRANVERLRGTIEVESVLGQGTTFRLTLPVTLATTRVLLVRAGDHLYALPVEAVQSVQLIASSEVFPLQGRPSFALDGAPIPLASLADLLELPPAPQPKEANREKPARPCVILMYGGEKLGVWVDAVVDEQEIILKPLGALLEGVRHLAGATILDTGDVALVLAPSDLLKTASRRGTFSGENALGASKSALELPEAPKTVLLVEDSITTRTQEKRILEGAGYRVVVAVDGLDGWNKLAVGEFDAVVSDVEMPNMDGLSLAARIRQNEKYKELPIILVTSLASEEDRRRGVEVGANAYITKGNFDQRMLLDTLKKLA